MTTMRAKFQVQSVEQFETSERIKMIAVAAKNYPVDGLHEDNTFAKFSPSGEFSIYVTNPALRGALKPGEKYYLDFTKAIE